MPSEEMVPPVPMKATLGRFALLTGYSSKTGRAADAATPVPRSIRRASDAQPIDPRRGAVEQAGLFVCTRAMRQPLAGVPEHAVAVRSFVDREIAFEHGAVGAEGRDAGLDVGPPRRGELLRAGRQLAFVHVEAEHPHAKAAQLHVHVGAGRELADTGAPVGEDGVALARVAAEPDRAANMVQHD